MAYQYVDSINQSPIRFVIKYEYPSDIFKLDCELTLSVTAENEKFRIQRLLNLFWHLHENRRRSLRKISQIQDYKGTLQILVDKDFTDHDAYDIDASWESFNECQVEIKFIEFLS
jgi:hypothetical protein